MGDDGNQMGRQSERLRHQDKTLKYCELLISAAALTEGENLNKILQFYFSWGSGYLVKLIKRGNTALCLRAVGSSLEGIRPFFSLTTIVCAET